MTKESEYKYILGIQSFASHDAGACIVRFSPIDGSLDFIAISEERLIRKKYPYVFPVHSIGYCMDYYGLKDMSQIELIVSDYIRVERWFNSGPAYNTSEFDYLKIKFNFDPKKIISINHHLAHAASVFYTSKFDESAILIIDGNGSDLETTSFYYGKNHSINLIESYKAHGIGAVYSAVTKWILGLGTGGEGKTMGLAPYGEKESSVLKINGKLDGIKNDFSDFIKRMPYSDVLNQIDAKNRINPIKINYEKCPNEKELLNPYFSRIAFDVQEETERVMKHLGNELFKKSHSKNICVAGGVALNSVGNKKMFDATDFEKIFVFPACSDAGIPFGLALWGYYNYENFKNFPKKRIDFNNAYTGKSYSDEQILNMFKEYDIPFKKSSTENIAKLIADGKIIGWFQGGSEYGPRALGHRSILADSRREEMKDILNLKVKHRESFRPFAPAVLLEHYNEYFDIDDESPYMLLVADVKKPESVPAITHVDGTARVQTVTKNDNGIFYDLIQDFFNITKIPVILNTSFNDAGEPIVETPEDATICFLNTEMDYLVLNNYLIDKRMINDPNLLNKMKIDRKNIIDSKFNEYVERFFTNFDKDECEKFVTESNKIAEWHVKYRSKYELETKILQWKKNKSKLVLIGTKDHTEFLLKHINGFSTLDVVGFIDFGKNDQENTENIHFPKLNIETLKNLEFDEILISSYEYMYDIEELLIDQNMKKPIYKVYDNASRSLMNTMSDLPFYNISN